MKLLRTVIVLGGFLALSGCALFDSVERRAQVEALELAQAAPSMQVGDFEVEVSRDLVVSEGLGFYPFADIVWREDPPGNRYEQIDMIVTAAAERGFAELEGDRVVDAQIEVLRFHSLTERTRYTVGGVHSLKIAMTLTDPETGEIVVPRREIKADLDALGGREAVAAEHAGVTQKRRISQHLADMFARELTEPGTTPSFSEDVVLRDQPEAAPMSPVEG